MIFAFTEIEGSVSRWASYPAAMQDAVRRHDAILRQVIEQHHGHVFKTMGGAFFAAFFRAEDAMAAMVAGQRALVSEDFSATDGLRVRVAINSGAAEQREGDYFGPPVNKVARLLALAHGGQILLSAETAALLDGALPGDPSLRELGTYHLKDIPEPQRVFQLIAPGLPAEFPPLRTLGTLPSDLTIIDAAEFRPIQDFSGRDDELAALQAALGNDGSIAVVHGLGGVGKSSIAREYGWRYRDQYSVMWWLNAETEDGIIDGLVRIGSMFVHGLDQLKDRRAAAHRVLHSMLGGFDKPVLVVFDNLEDESLLRSWLPRTARALVTSRDANWGTSVTPIALQTWSLEAAREYLRSASGRSDLSAGDAHSIAQALGALPLALAHAAAALRNLRMVTPRRYLERINEHLKRAPRGVEYPRSVFATFSTAITQAEQQALGAAAVLCFTASFAPDAIPEELLRQAVDRCPEGLRPILPAGNALDLRSVLIDDMHFDLALGELCRLALISFDRSARTYSMHRLVQLAAGSLVCNVAAWQELAVSSAHAAFPRTQFAAWPQCERMLPHARAVLDALGNTEPQSAVDLMRRCANYLWARGEYAASEQLCTRALTICERLLGPTHPKVAMSLNNLAVLYMESGRFDEADTLLRRALEIQENALGPDHLEVATTLNNLAIVCMELGRHADAVALATRGLEVRRTALGPEHPDTVLFLNNLGVLYHRAQGRNAEAESLLTRVLEIRERTLGPDHPDVALCLMHLADVYADSGRGAEAEPLYVRALAIWDKALGQFRPDHPDIAEALHGLAKLYRAERRYSDAEPLFVRALAIREKVLGPDHPLTRATREALGMAAT